MHVPRKVPPYRKKDLETVAEGVREIAPPRCPATVLEEATPCLARRDKRGLVRDGNADRVLDLEVRIGGKTLSPLFLPFGASRPITEFALEHPGHAPRRRSG